MKMIEFSADGNTWFSTAYPGWQLRREIDELPESASRNDIEKWLLEHTGARIEYSTDGGYAFVSFRTKNVSEDAGRLVTMLKMHYKVRSLRQDDVNSLVGQNFGFRSNSNQTPSNVRVRINQIRTMQKIKYVFQDSKGDVWFSEEAQPEVIGKTYYISMITQYIPLTMAEPNRNEVSTGHDLTPIIRGHVYKITHIDQPAVSYMDSAIVSFFEQQTITPITDYVIVESARAYDVETEVALGKTFACAVIASKTNKYYVHSRSNPYKIGDTFFVKKLAVKMMTDALTDYGAAFYYDDQVNIVEKVSEGIVEQIMKLDTKLEEALESNDSTKITVALYESIQLRDATVDALTKLNETIKKSRQKILQMVAKPRSDDS